jgi:hypothetical protein
MHDDGIGFSLPWRRVMEARLRRLPRDATVARLSDLGEMASPRGFEPRFSP